jgi:long-chain acyl-CoA synthetase
VGGDGDTATKAGTGAKTLAGMVLQAVDEYDGAALRYHDGDDWTDVSYDELGEAVREIAGGLISLGVEQGDRVAIFSDTRAEWTLADLSGVLAAAVVVPIYQTASAEEARHVLEDSGSKVVFCENEDLLGKAKEAAEELDVEQFVLFEGSADGAMSLDELREKGSDCESEVDERIESLGPDDVFTIIYTSGTTGPPKGCVLTHGNYRANAEMLEQIAEMGDDSVVFLFLPLAHALSRMTQMVAIDVGATIGYWRGDKDKMQDDLKAIAPTHFPAVPRIFEKIYEQARSQASGKVKGKIFEQAVEVGREVRLLERQGEEAGAVLRKEYELADKQVLSKVRDIFGGNLELAITGAAPVAKEMLEFFDACGVLILEGYGSTETSAVATANSVDDFKFGTVGRAVPGSEVKIAEDSADDEDEDGEEDEDREGDEEQEDDRGEIMVKGPHVFQGYHGLEDETKEVLTDDGWFRTGDLGTIDEDGFVTIAGRTKEIIVTSSGKNITPTNIEEKITDSPIVSQAIVYGDDRPYLVALVTLDEDNTDGDKESAHDDVQKAIDSANEDLAKIEQVKKFTILDRELSQDEGELTPTLKVKREKVYENFEDEINALYDDDDGDGGGGDRDDDGDDDDS